MPTIPLLRIYPYRHTGNKKFCWVGPNFPLLGPCPKAVLSPGASPSQMFHTPSHICNSGALFIEPHLPVGTSRSIPYQMPQRLSEHICILLLNKLGCGAESSGVRSGLWHITLQSSWPWGHWILRFSSKAGHIFRVSFLSLVLPTTPSSYQKGTLIWRRRLLEAARHSAPLSGGSTRTDLQFWLLSSFLAIWVVHTVHMTWNVRCQWPYEPRAWIQSTTNMPYLA